MNHVKVHFFLDTTLTYQDPFFKKNYNHQLIRFSETHNFKIYMSSVVYEETRNKYELNTSERITKLETALKELENYDPDVLNTVSINCTLNDFMKKFDDFYGDLISRGVLEVLDYDNSLLPNLVERSIKRIKPFGRNKQEFRDALTWLTYAKIAEENELTNCFFITANVDDFCNEKTKNTIHPDLLEDTQRINHYVSAKDLIENEPVLKQYIRYSDMVAWLSKTVIDEEYILDEVVPIFENQIKESFTDYILRWGPENITEYVYFPSSIEVGAVDVVSASEVQATIIGSQIVVSGDIDVDAEIHLYYDPVSDHHHYRGDEYVMIGSEIGQVVCTFTFTMDKEKIHRDSLELDNFDVLQKASFSDLRDDYDDERY